MRIYPIQSDADHHRALKRIEGLMERVLSAEEDAELDALVTLVGAYEDKQFPIAKAAPIAVIEFMMDQRGLTRKDLQPMIGSRARVSEVLSGKRSLTLAMVRALSSAWAISADLLVGAAVEKKHIKARPGSSRAPSRKTRTPSGRSSDKKQVVAG